MRLQRLRASMQRLGADASLITTKENVAYYSGFTGTSSQLLITKEHKLFFTDFRYAEQAEAETDYTVVETKGQERIDTLFDHAKKLGVKKLGIDLSGVSYMAYKAYQKKISENDIIDISQDVSAQRAVKDVNELALIEKGAKHNDALFAHLRGLLRPGISENDIKAEIIYFMHKNGAESAFPPIVASGENSSLPHATPSDRILRPGDLLTLDYGCRFNGYCSDFTRTVAISYMDKERQKVYDIVKCAGERALLALMPGVHAHRVDAAAREYIAQHGFGEAFGHGVGHGVGLFIHEAPVMNALSKAILEEGMVITIEPGIYMTGRFGVRTEDLCVIKQSGCVNLTASPRDAIII